MRNDLVAMSDHGTELPIQNVRSIDANRGTSRHGVQQYRSFGVTKSIAWRYSILNLAARTTLPHFSISTLMRMPKSAGEFAIGTKPSVASFSFTSG
jgi:hypothetical protein